jgi:hypothetical protein
MTVSGLLSPPKILAAGLIVMKRLVGWSQRPSHLIACSAPIKDQPAVWRLSPSYQWFLALG